MRTSQERVKINNRYLLYIANPLFEITNKKVLNNEEPKR